MSQKVWLNGDVNTSAKWSEKTREGRDLEVGEPEKSRPPDFTLCQDIPIPLPNPNTNPGICHICEHKQKGFLVFSEARLSRPAVMDREVNNNESSGDQQQSPSSSKGVVNVHAISAETSSANRNPFSIETILCKDEHKDPRTTVIYSTKGIHLPSWQRPQLSSTGREPLNVQGPLTKSVIFVLNSSHRDHNALHRVFVC